MDSKSNALLKKKEDFTAVTKECQLFDKLFETIKKAEKIKKVLVIRSGRVWMVKEIMALFRRKHPEIEISLLTQPSVQEELKAEKSFKRLFLMKNSKKIGIFNIGLKTLLSLRKERFDMVVVPLSGKSLNERMLVYNNRNVHNCIMLIKPENVGFVDSEGTTILKHFKPLKYFLNYFFCIKLFWIAFIKVFMFAFMLLALTAIIGCDLWSMLKSRLWGRSHG